MKHICDNSIEYASAMATRMQGDTIYCTEALWEKIKQHQGLTLCKRLVYEEYGTDTGISFCTSEGIKTMEAGKLYDKDLNEI